MAFLYIAALFDTVFDRVLFIVMRGKAPNISNVGTRPSSPAVSLMALRAICSAFSFNRPSNSNLTMS